MKSLVFCVPAAEIICGRKTFGWEFYPMHPNPLLPHYKLRYTVLTGSNYLTQLTAGVPQLYVT